MAIIYNEIEIRRRAEKDLSSIPKSEA